MVNKLRIKKGDLVKVIAGKHKGKEGKIIEVIPADNKVKVSGVNVAKKHKKPSAQGAGGIIEIELPINASNVAYVDPKSGKATRVGYKILKDGKKVRYAKDSGEVIDS